MHVLVRWWVTGSVPETAKHVLGEREKGKESRLTFHNETSCIT